jgi:hypothetical protein
MMQVHDSIVFQIPVSAGWPEHARLLAWIKKSLETPLTVHGRDFIIPVDTMMGLCLFKKKMKTIKDVSNPTLLETAYNELRSA